MAGTWVLLLDGAVERFGPDDSSFVRGDGTFSLVGAV